MIYKHFVNNKMLDFEITRFDAALFDACQSSAGVKSPRRRPWHVYFRSGQPACAAAPQLPSTKSRVHTSNPAPPLLPAVSTSLLPSPQHDALVISRRREEKTWFRENLLRGGGGVSGGGGWLSWEEKDMHAGARTTRLKACICMHLYCTTVVNVVRLERAALIRWPGNRPSLMLHCVVLLQSLKFNNFHVIFSYGCMSAKCSPQRLWLQKWKMVVSEVLYKHIGAVHTPPFTCQRGLHCP